MVWIGTGCVVGSAARGELGAFLRERRGRLTPGDVGLIAGPPRRTPGLRREEIAELAGVSAGYYARLEQGSAPHPSESVLAALARVLRLTADEERHLRALAAWPGPVPAGAGAVPAGAGAVPAGAAVSAGVRDDGAVIEQVSRSALRVMEMLRPPTAAIVLGRIGDVLAWNEYAPRLFPGRLPTEERHPSARSNNARYVFCDPRAREIFPRWEEVADDTVAHLRAAAGHLVDDPGFRELVDDLLATSPEFAARWQRRDVRRHVSGEKYLNHPVLGRLTVDYEVLAVLDQPDQFLVVYGLGDVEIPEPAATS
ncbi:helix-turn-helix transcriptional regulator [Kribbella solani]|uniref:helix-turn-helix transcriptional regulator n=1 Tax=Kribbella solani TaxID=236067 RepID=UPI001EE27624|nr:helix-turn-helix transcriptional regulator [Kribbella solani]